MGNILKETVTKAAGNVTQSVASAVIVFLITTYVLVDIGKKDEAEESADTTKTEMNIATPTKRDGDMKPGGEAKTRVNAPEQKAVPAGTEPVATPQSSERRSTPVQDSPERQVMNTAAGRSGDVKGTPATSEVRAKADTAAKEKKPEDELKKVKKRADDVFDELDEEVNKKPPLEFGD